MKNEENSLKLSKNEEKIPKSDEINENLNVENLKKLDSATQKPSSKSPLPSNQQNIESSSILVNPSETQSLLDEKLQEIEKSQFSKKNNDVIEEEPHLEKGEDYAEELDRIKHELIERINGLDVAIFEVICLICLIFNTFRLEYQKKHET